MNRITVAALAALLAAGTTGALAQDITEPPAGGQSVPQTGPGEVTETGETELQSQINESPIERVNPEVGAEQSAEALEEETGVPMEVQPGGVVTPVN